MPVVRPLVAAFGVVCEVKNSNSRDWVLQRADGRGGLPAVKSSRLLDVIFHGLTCGGYLHFCDVNQILIGVDVSLRVHVVSFMTLKNFRIVHFPSPLFGENLNLSPPSSTVPMMVVSRSPAAA